MYICILIKIMPGTNEYPLDILKPLSIGSLYISIKLPCYVKVSSLFTVSHFLYNVIYGHDDDNGEIITSLEARPQWFCIMTRHYNLKTC